MYYGTIMHIGEAPNALSFVLYGNMTLEGRHGARAQGIWEIRDRWIFHCMYRIISFSPLKLNTLQFSEEKIKE